MSFMEVHLPQLHSIPKLYWGSLERKLEHEIFDAGNYFSLMLDEKNKYHAFTSAEDGLQKDDPNNIFLIDHALTYEAENAEANLQKHPTVLKRIAALVDVEVEEDNAEVLQKVLEKIWKFNGCYQMRKVGYMDGKVVEQMLGEDDELIPLWYLMDEFGSRVAHSDEPNVAFENFYYVKGGLMVTVMFLLHDLKYGDEIFRDYVDKVHGDAETKAARLYPWFPNKLHLENVSDTWPSKLLEMKEEIDRCKETSDNDNESLLSLSKPLKVFTTSHYVRDHLKSKDFVLVDNENDANILFLIEHFKDFGSLGNRFVNQFPNEKILTCKDLFAETAMRSVAYKYKDDVGAIPKALLENRGPLWLPTTFNLFSELPQFLKYYKSKEAASVSDNTWIVKPWNLARSIGHTVTQNLDQIIKLTGSGPKVACKYLDESVLYNRKGVGWVKQDYRYCIYVKSVNPLEAYIHKVFWLRFGNKPFEMTDFYDFEIHYTHMWYKDLELFEVPYNEYIPIFHEMHPQLDWNQIQEQINSAIKELLISATMEAPPHGLGKSNKCRAFYGIDLMLVWNDKEHTSARPVLLEANFNSDIKRACRDVPRFVDEMFELLFLEKLSDNFVKL